MWYMFCIMLKKMGVILLFVTISPWGQDASKQQQASSSAAANQTTQADNPVPPPQPVVQPTVTAPQGKPAATDNHQDSPPKPLSWFLRPEWVIVWVTVVYTVLTGFTLRAIKKQADLMAEQLKDAQTNAAASSVTTAETLAAIKEQNEHLLISAKAATKMALASDKSAKAALTQIEMMKDQEHARVEIKAMGLEFTRVGDEFWHMRTTIELRNVGVGRAYVRLAKGTLVMMENEMPVDPYLKALDVVDGFVDPDKAVTESFYFFQPDEAALSDYSHKIWHGDLQPRITGFIEYETVGTRFHRDFSYVWIGNGGPMNIGAMLTVAEDFAPESPQERTSHGYWLPNSLWLTGWSGSNDEYEMKPKKKATKPRQNTN